MKRKKKYTVSLDPVTCVYRVWDKDGNYLKDMSYDAMERMRKRIERLLNGAKR